MARYVVAHVISSPAGAVRTARLMIEGVPDKTTPAEVIEALNAAPVPKGQTGYAVLFSEGGVPFGNHEVIAEGRAGWRKGIEGLGDAKATTWEQITREPVSSDLRRITLRLKPADYGTVALAAEHAGESLQAWCETVLLAAANGEGGPRA